MPSSTPEDDLELRLSDMLDDISDGTMLSFRGKLQKFLHTGSSTIANRPLKRELPDDIATDTKRVKRESSTSTDTPLSPRAYPALLTAAKRKRKPPEPHHSPPASSSLLRDMIPPNLILLFVGVNPGILTGKTGYTYSHPSNLFWKLLHSSGITHVRHPPSDTYKLPDLYSIGNTNIVERPTRDASMLSKAEMDAGVPVLEAKVAEKRPKAVALVGKSVWEAVWRVKYGRGIRKEEFRYGWQSITENMGCSPNSDWAGAPVFVATTTSGLAASMTFAEKQDIWAELGRWVVETRKEREQLNSQ